MDTPVFCLVVASIFEKLIRVDGRIRVEGKVVIFWFYLDDLIFQAPTDLCDQVFTVIEEAFKEYGLNFNGPKSKLHIPELASTPIP